MGRGADRWLLETAMKLEPPISINLRKHGDSQFVMQSMMLGIALMFWAAAKATTEPVMSPDTYGAWVTSIPAEIWAGSIMLASFVFLLGVLINGEWRWSPALRLVGAVWHVFTLGAFCFGAFGTANGSPVLMMCVGALGVHLWFSWINLGDLHRAIWSSK
jgi:hypothetical protein